MSVTEIPKTLIHRFIQIGKKESFTQLHEIDREFPETKSGDFMRLSPESWYRVAENLNKVELCALIKMLTVAEKQLPNCKAGSVSPVFWLFIKLKEHFPSEQDKMADWVLRNTDNHYIPFSNYGAHSLEEYYKHYREWEERLEASRKAEEARQTETKTRKAQRATHNLFGAIRRKDKKAIVALLSLGADVYAPDSSGKTAIDYAQEMKDSEILSILKKQKSVES